MQKGALTLMPCPLSWICRILDPPSLDMTVMDVAPASKAFSSSSLRALEGFWMISPAAMRFTTPGSSRVMTAGPAIAMADGCPPIAGPWRTGSQPCGDDVSAAYCPGQNFSKITTGTNVCAGMWSAWQALELFVPPDRFRPCCACSAVFR